MKLSEHLAQYETMAQTWLKDNGFNVRDVTTGRAAWSVAHKSGITRHAYDLSRDILDSHIQTALEKIFPNAIFQDKKRY